MIGYLYGNISKLTSYYILWMHIIIKKKLQWWKLTIWIHYFYCLLRLLSSFSLDIIGNIRIEGLSKRNNQILILY